jgi:hypothetical protein
LNNLAPIGISTYSRINHLKRTVNALKNNKLAEKSVLYIFSDAPKEGDEKKVGKVREYIKKIDGFKEVNIVERETNNRIFNNRDGMKLMLNKYGKMIFMEEDIVTAPGFLIYMNKALNYYFENKKIFSIGGFSPVNHNINSDVYFSPRFMGWGFAIWQDRFSMLEELPLFNIIKQDKDLINKLKDMGDDMLSMIIKEANSDIDALDIKACYLSAKNDMLNVLPSKTLVKNTGLDGSGEHCGNKNIYINQTLSKKIEFDFKEPFISEKIIHKNNQKYKNNLYKKIVILSKKIKLYNFLRHIKEMIIE